MSCYVHRTSITRPSGPVLGSSPTEPKGSYKIMMTILSRVVAWPRPLRPRRGKKAVDIGQMSLRSRRIRRSAIHVGHCRVKSTLLDAVEQRLLRIPGGRVLVHRTGIVTMSSSASSCTFCSPSPLLNLGGLISLWATMPAWPPSIRSSIINRECTYV